MDLKLKIKTKFRRRISMKKLKKQKFQKNMKFEKKSEFKKLKINQNLFHLKKLNKKKQESNDTSAF